MDSSTVWMMTSAAFVLLMTPGLALFYGGLVRVKSVVNMLMFSVTAMGVVGVLWVLYGYGMTFFVEGETGFAGNPLTHFGLLNASAETLITAAFGVTFAMISTALISGAIADRVGLGPWILFSGVWASLVYFPVAAWVWGGGWIQNLGETLGLPDVIDWAGGTAVHINAGAAALALALVAGKRLGFSRALQAPHSIPLVIIGGAILWFGWFGFNAGTAATDREIGLIVVNTIAAPVAAIVGWLIVDTVRGKKPSAVGAMSGVVAGLVAITPACAHLEPLWALLLGFIAGAACAFAIEAKYRFGYDDSLDVVGLHLVAGVIGTMFLGFFATDTGLFVGGDGGQLIVQTISIVAVASYSFVVSLAIALAIRKTIGLRVSKQDEEAGIDVTRHGEAAYSMRVSSSQAP